MWIQNKKIQTKAPRYESLLDDFREIHGLIQFEPEAELHPSQVFILFLTKPEEDKEDCSSQKVQERIDEYLKFLPESKRNSIKLIKCQVSSSELHLISLSRIYPWCMMDSVWFLPALIRLDGERTLFCVDLLNIHKLDLVFSKLKRVSFHSKTFNLPVSPEKCTAAKLSQGECSVHGRVPTVPGASFDDIKIPTVKKTDDSKFSGRVDEICEKFKITEVERRQKEEPVVEPPTSVKEIKPRKRKQKGKGKGNKKK